MPVDFKDILGNLETVQTLRAPPSFVQSAPRRPFFALDSPAANLPQKASRIWRIFTAHSAPFKPSAPLTIRVEKLHDCSFDTYTHPTWQFSVNIMVFETFHHLIWKRNEHTAPPFPSYPSPSPLWHPLSNEVRVSVTGEFTFGKFLQLILEFSLDKFLNILFLERVLLFPIWIWLSFTACGHRMANRKWEETKQQPSMLPGLPVPGCSLVAFHFLWAILCPQAVQLHTLTVLS